MCGSIIPLKSNLYYDEKVHVPYDRSSDRLFYP